MNILNNISGIYFLGAGGIGMSALVRYFLEGGFEVSGYDRTETDLTKDLILEGCNIIYSDNIDLIPLAYKNTDTTIVVYTPAIPESNLLLNWFRDEGFRIYKRAEVLGEISKKSNSITVAGTHGKTSVSTLTAHLLKQSSVDCTAFLGGISKNYNSNLILGTSDITVIEADEFDRSFHFLRPYISLITSLDPDHLDIYGNYENMLEAFNYYVSLTSEEGCIVVHNKIRGKIRNTGNIRIYTYGLDKESDFRIVDLKTEAGAYNFNVVTPFGELKDMVSISPGKLSLENCIAAISLATLAGVKDFEIRKALIYFKGVKRRFEIRVDMGDITYIDDYAHHPEELSYFISSVKDFYGDRKITIVFQPHLFSRTLEHADSFAKTLEMADDIILLPIYPAREKPIEGVDSTLILKQISEGKGKLLEKDELIDYLKEADLDILLTVGAGDIDTLVVPVEALIRRRSI